MNESINGTPPPHPPGVWKPPLTTYFSTACIVIAADGDQIYFLNSANGCHGTRQPYCALYCTNKDTGILIGIFSIPTVIYLYVHIQY